MKFFARFFSKKRRLLADTPRCRMPPAGEITPGFACSEVRQ
jgi:hypothetical protein